MNRLPAIFVALLVFTATLAAAHPAAAGEEGPCGPDGLHQVGDTDTCSHGKDPVYPFWRNAGAAVTVADAPLPVTCDGDGRSGRRVQAMYLYETGQPNRIDQYRSLLQTRVAQVDAMFNASAQQTGGTRHARFVHDENCLAVIEPIAMSSDAVNGQLWTLEEELNAAKIGRFDRNYLFFTDVTNNFAGGVANLAPDDTSDPKFNSSNIAMKVGVIYRGTTEPRVTPPDRYWSEYSAAHELGHMLGAVQNSAPHSSGAGHCNDNFEIMCYSDGGPASHFEEVCPLTFDNKGIFDCGHDDYFSTNPGAGNYLLTHWNLANSAYLIGSPALPQTDILVDSFTAPKLKKVSGKMNFKGTLNVAQGPTATYIMATVAEYYLSDDALFDPSDKRLNGFTNMGLVDHTPFGFKFSVKYVLAVVDSTNVLPEANESNNVLSFGPITK